MDFALTSEQKAIRDAIARICERFDDDYWLEKDRAGGFPFDFYDAIARDGWLGICIPEQYGGSGFCIAEAAVIGRTIAPTGARREGAHAGANKTFWVETLGSFAQTAPKQP